MIYPFAVYWGLTHGSARSVGLIGLGIAIPLFGIRLWNNEHGRAALRVPILVLALLTFGAVFDDPRFVLAMPVILNLALLILFAAVASVGPHDRTLRAARGGRPHPRQGSTLPAGDGGVVRLLRDQRVRGPRIRAVRRSRGLGGVQRWRRLRPHGAMFAGEHVVRRYRFRDFGAGPHDRLLARLFPRHEARS